MGMQEGISRADSEESRMLKNLSTPEALEIIGRQFDLDGTPLEEYISTALHSAGYAVTRNTMPLGFDILLQTAHRISETNLQMPSGSPISLTAKDNYVWQQGAYDMSIAYHESRIFETGVSFDEYGNLIIGKVQKERLDQVYRAGISPGDVVYAEKTLADGYINEMDTWIGTRYKKIATGAHTLALVLTTALYGPHSSGNVLFYAADRHPEITSRLRRIDSLEADNLNPDAVFHTTIMRYRSQIHGMRPFIDFATMLSGIGVENISALPYRDFLKADVHEIMNKAYLYFTDPNHTNRHRYWKLIEDAYNQQG